MDIYICSKIVDTTSTLSMQSMLYLGGFGGMPPQEIRLIEIEFGSNFE